MEELLRAIHEDLEYLESEAVNEERFHSAQRVRQIKKNLTALFDKIDEEN